VAFADSPAAWELVAALGVFGDGASSAQAPRAPANATTATAPITSNLFDVDEIDLCFLI
jgi:hypothetical protein